MHLPVFNKYNLHRYKPLHGRLRFSSPPGPSPKGMGANRPAHLFLRLQPLQWMRTLSVQHLGLTPRYLDDCGFGETISMKTAVGQDPEEASADT